jgi:hypothetical protein
MIEVVKRWAVYLVAFLVVLLVVVTCVNKTGDTLKGEQNVYQKQLERKVKSLELIKRNTAKYIDSLKKEDKKKDKVIFKLKEQPVYSSLILRFYYQQ